MATPFNLTARLNIQGPIGVKPVVDSLRRQLKDVRADIRINVDQKVNAQLQTLNKTLATTEARLKAIEASSAAAAKNLSALSTASKKTATAQSSAAKSTAATNAVLAKTARGAAEAASEVQEFGRVSGLAIRRFAGFTIATGVIFGFINAVQQATREAIEFEREVAKIAQVTGNSIQGLASLEKEVTRLSTSLGVSSAELILAARTLNQAGFAASDARVALEALAKSSLAPTFKDIASTTEGAIAALRQFDLGAKQLESTLGSINAVAGKFAVESDDIIQAIRRTGGVFAAASNPQNAREAQQSLREFVALFTSVRATTRESSESIATGLRTIFTRIQRRGTIDALRELNVQLEEGGKFVGPFEAVKRLSSALKDLDPQDVRFADIVEELGGFRQIGKVIPLIQRFATATDALKVATRGQDSLTRDAVVAQQTLAVQIEQTRQRFLALIRDITKSDAFKLIAASILKGANALIKFGETLKPIIPALTAFAAVKSVGVVRNFLRGFGRGVSSAGGAAGLGERLGGGSAAQQTSTRAQNTAATQANTQAVQNSTTQSKTSSTANKSLQTALGNNTKALQSLQVAIQGLTRAVSARAITGGNPRGFATGGLIPGMGDGDRVPFLGMGGEFVVNRRGVKKAGLGNLISLNRATGDMVPARMGQKVQKFATGDQIKRVLAGTGGASDFQSLLGAEFSGLLPAGTRKSQLRRDSKNPQIQQAFRDIEARAKKKAQSMASQQAEAVAAIPQFTGPGGEPAVAGVFAERKSVGNISSTVADKNVLNILKSAGLIDDKVDKVNMPIFPAFLDQKKSDQVISTIETAISGTVSSLAGILGRGLKPNDPLVQSLISGSGVNLQDAAGKLFEAGTKAGLRLENINSSLDFPNRGQVAALESLFGPIPSGVADAKLRANAESYGQIRREYASFLAANARPTQRRQGGGLTNLADVLLTPGELVFDPRASVEAGLGNLRKFNKFGDPGNLAPVKTGNIFKVPGSGSRDTFPTQLPTGSFVVRKRSAERFARGGTVGMQDGDRPPRLESALSQINSRVALFVSNVDRAFQKFESSGGEFTEGLERLAGQIGVSTEKLVKFAQQRAEGVEGTPGDGGGIQGGGVRRAIETQAATQILADTEREAAIVRETLGGRGTRTGADPQAVSRAQQAVRAEREQGLRGGTADQPGLPLIPVAVEQAAVEREFAGRQRTTPVGGGPSLPERVRQRVIASGGVAGIEPEQPKTPSTLPPGVADILAGKGPAQPPEPSALAGLTKFEQEFEKGGDSVADFISALDIAEVKLKEADLVPDPAAPGGRRNRRSIAVNAIEDADRARQRERDAARSQTFEGQAAAAQGRAQTQRIIEEARLGSQGVQDRERQRAAQIGGTGTRQNEAAQKAFEVALKRGATAQEAYAAAGKAATAVLKQQQRSTAAVKAAQDNLTRTIQQSGKRSQAAQQAQAQLTAARRKLAQATNNAAQRQQAAAGKPGFSAGGAVVGGGLLGPLGALVGGKAVGGLRGLGRKFAGTRLGKGLGAFGTKAGDFFSSGKGTTALLAAPFLASQLPANSPTAKGLQSAISGAVGGGFTGAQIGSAFGPVGTAVGAVGGAVVGGAASFISARRDARFEAAQTKLTDSTDKLSKAFDDLQENFNDTNLKRFNQALSVSIASVAQLQDAFKKEQEFGGSIGSTVAGIFNLSGVLGVGNNAERAAIGAEAGPLKVLSLEFRKTFAGITDDLGAAAFLISPALAIADKFGAFGTRQEALQEERDIINKRNERIARETFTALQPASRSALKNFQGQIQANVQGVGVDAVAAGALSGANADRFINQQLAQFTRDSKEGVQALAALDLDKFKKIEPSLRAAIDTAGKPTEEYFRILERAGREVLREELKKQVAVARTQALIERNLKAIEASAEAIRKVGDAASLAAVDLANGAQILTNIGSVISGGTVGAGEIANPFENLDIRTPREIQQGLQALTDAAGGRLRGAAARIPNNIGESRIVGQNLTRVLNEAVTNAGRGGLRGLSREQAAIRAVSSDRRLAGLSRQTRLDIISSLRGIFGNRQGQGQLALDSQLKENENLAKEFTKTLQASENTAKAAFQAIVDGNKRLADASNQLANTVIAANNKFDQAFKLATERRLQIARLGGTDPGIAGTQRAQDAFVRRLTGRAGIGGPGGTTNIGVIQGAITNLQNQLVRDAKLRDQVGTSNRAAFQALTDRIANNTVKLNDATRALNEVATNTATLSAIQSKLAEIQQRREAGSGFLEKLSAARFDPKAALDLNKAVGDAFKLFAGRGAGVDGGAALATEIGAILGPEAAKSIKVAIDRSRLASLGAGPGTRRLLLGAGVGTKPGTSGPERVLIAQFKAVSDRQIAAITAQGNIVNNQTTQIVLAIRQLALSFRQSLFNALGRGRGPVRRNRGGEIGGTFKGDRDTELANLTVGEFVVRRKVAKKYKPQLALLNAGLPVERAFGGEGLRRGGPVKNRFQVAAARGLARRRRLAARTGSSRYLRGARFQTLAARASGNLGVTLADTRKRLKAEYQRQRVAKAAEFAAGRTVLVRDAKGRLRGRVPARKLIERYNAQVRNQLAYKAEIDDIYAQVNQQVRDGKIPRPVPGNPDSIRQYRAAWQAIARGKKLGRPPRVFDANLKAAFKGGIPLNNPFTRAVKRQLDAGKFSGGYFGKDAITGLPLFRGTGFEQQWLRSPFGGFQSGGSVGSTAGPNKITSGVVPGEFVVNKNAATKNRAFLQSLNDSGAVPGFQAGGLVSPVESPLTAFARTNPSFTRSTIGPTGGTATGSGGSLVSSEATGAMRTFASAANALAPALNNFGQFATQLQQAAQALQNVNIPSSITLEVAPIQVNVVVNGVEAFSQMQDSIRTLVTGEISAAIARHIDVTTGETKESFVQQPNTFL